ncbi:MAG TPA: ABC transporter substrate-binding protein [Solirubrobacterales bacterium]|nr:ABC transporter substrate-binding protein [Solirubrobacterales bacterium]
MRSLAALLAAILAAGIAGCGGGAEPGASREATLVLDFQPNAVHAGIYSALRHGDYEAAGVSLEIREPTESTDAPRLLEVGGAELAILTAGDLGVALERGLALRPVAEIVREPLGAVIAADRREIAEPRDLEGARVGVTGLPSDDAVLDAVLEAGGGDPAAVERVQIGFESVAALAAGRLDAATGFWSAEGVALRRLGVPTREFRVSDHGGSYPELLLVAAQRGDRELAAAVVEATERGYRRLREDPERALDDLLASVPGLDRAEQQAQLEALLAAGAFGERIRRPNLDGWLEFAARHGIVDTEAVRERLSEVGAGP